MGWICPTFQRPERLAELALSWEKCEPGRSLWVRVWEDDPRKDDYFKYEWPESWTLYESPAEWCGEALNEYFDWHPNEKYYGFIADDIVLRTWNGLRELEKLADPMYMSYPNDTLHRHQGATHFCVGGMLARTLGYFVPRSLKHHFIDTALYTVANNCGLARYCPQVIFQHKHFLVEAAERDDTYKRIWGDMPLEEIKNLKQVPGAEEWTRWVATELRGDVNKVRKELLRFEDWKAWEEEDASIAMLGVESGAV